MEKRADSDTHASPGDLALALRGQCLLVAALCVLVLMAQGSYADTGTIIYWTCVLLLVVPVWSLWSWKRLTGSLFDPYSLLLIATLAFNGGQAILEVFHLNQYGILNGEFYPDTVLQTLLVVSTGLVMLHWGGLLSVVGRAGETKRPPAGAGLAPTAGDVRLIGWLLLLVSIVPAMMQLRESVALVMESGYFALYGRPFQSGIENLPTVLAEFLTPAALFILVGGKGRRLDMWVSGVVIAAQALTALFLGNRGAAVLPLIAYLWIRHYYVRPISGKKLLAAAAVIVVVVFPLVSATRRVSGEERLSVAYLLDAYSSLRNPAVAIAFEMGSSMNTIAYSLELVPESRDFDLGAGYLRALRAVIPTSIWGSEPECRKYSDWLVWTVAPSTAAHGGGLGYSFLAEAYTNFGWVGVILVPCCLGFLAGRLYVRSSMLKEPATVALVGAILPRLLFMVRSESTIVVRAALYYAVVPYALAVVAAAVRTSHTGRRTEVGEGAGGTRER